MDINVNKRDREDSSSPSTDSVQSPQYKSQRRASGVHDNTTTQNRDNSVYTTDAQNIDKTYDLIQEMRKEQNEALAHIKLEHTATKKMFESKLDKLKKELLGVNDR